MKIRLIQDYSKLCEFAGDTLYIYKWKENAFYAHWEKGNEIFRVNIPQKFNHILIGTRNVKSFKRRLYKHFPPEHVILKVMTHKGFFIGKNNNNNNYTPKELVHENNRGVMIRLYCQWAELLHKQIRAKGQAYFFINALSQYQSLSQCFLTHFKLPPKGLFRLNYDGSLKFISDEVFKHFPFPFNMTSIEVDDVNNEITLTTVKVASFIQCNNNNNDDDDDRNVEIRTTTGNNNDDDETLCTTYLSNPDSGLIILLKGEKSVALLEKMKKRKKLFLSWRIIINISEFREHFTNIITKKNDDNIFLSLPIILQLLHMTIKDNVKPTSIALHYFYHFMLQRNVPVLLLLRKNKTNNDRQKKIKGGYVFAPRLGVYDNVGVVDFRSLYPNIIIRYAIAKGNVARVPVTEYKLKEKWYKTHFYTIITDDEEKYVLLSLKIQNHPIQLLFQHLIKRRFFEQQVNKNDILAKIIKIITNSIYGFYYLSYIPSLYDPLSAAMITRYGRYHLRTAKQFITKHFPGTVCLYGDTDSLFLSFSSNNNKNLLKDIVQFYNSRHDLKLTIESQFQRLILIRKKQYIGKYDDDDDDDKYKFSGFPRAGVPPKMYQLMIDILRYALLGRCDYPVLIESFLKEANAAAAVAQQSEFFLRKNNNNEPVFKLITNTSTYHHHYYCLENEYNPTLHVIDKKGTILYYLEKILNPLFVTILKQPPLATIFSHEDDNNNNNDNKCLIIIKKYLSMGYKILDFSSSSPPPLNIKFDRIYFKDDKIQTFWESPPPHSSSSPLLSLLLNVTFNVEGKYIIINDTLFEKSPRFYSLRKLEESLISIFEYEKYSYILYHHTQIVCTFLNNNNNNKFFPPSLLLKLFLQFIYGTIIVTNNKNEEEQTRNFLILVRNRQNLVNGIIINDDDVVTMMTTTL